MKSIIMNPASAMAMALFFSASAASPAPAQESPAPTAAPNLGAARVMKRQVDPSVCLSSVWGKVGGIPQPESYTYTYTDGNGGSASGVAHIPSWGTGTSLTRDCEETIAASLSGGIMSYSSEVQAYLDTALDEARDLVTECNLVEPVTISIDAQCTRSLTFIFVDYGPPILPVTVTRGPPVTATESKGPWDLPTFTVSPSPTETGIEDDKDSPGNRMSMSGLSAVASTMVALILLKVI